jgi:hypothetical protein
VRITEQEARLTQTIPARKPAAGAHHTECPHCHKEFVAHMDVRQPPRLQGAKCPNCKLFVPARLLPARQPSKKGVRAAR